MYLCLCRTVVIVHNFLCCACKGNDLVGKLFQRNFIGVAHVHRQILSIVVGPVKASLGLSDLQIGLLQGFAFTAVIAVTAVMTAPIVDKGNRVRLVGISMAIWCTMTIGCGLATNFGMMLFARTGLAIAEAVIPMAVLSLIFESAGYVISATLFMVVLLRAFGGIAWWRAAWCGIRASSAVYRPGLPLHGRGSADSAARVLLARKQDASRRHAAW